MKIDVLTLFPSIISSLKDYSIIGRSIEAGLIELNTINIRDFSKNKHKKVDDYPYGGGKGMLMQIEPIDLALKSVLREESHVVYLTPQGKTLTQTKAIQLSKYDHLVLLAGHYEGIDNRVVEFMVDEEISIGDYVLSGGEIPAMVLIDTIARMLEGVLAEETSYIDESHYLGLLEYPQYTRPQNYKGMKVPMTLVNGDHLKIEKWKNLSSIITTIKKRPDLLNSLYEDKEKIQLLQDLLNKIK